MSDLIVLRDHSQPCEHGSLWSHWIKVREAKWWNEPECVGGREIVLERLANGDWRELVSESSGGAGQQAES